MTNWYGKGQVGVDGNTLHWAAHNIIGDPSFNVGLNGAMYPFMLNINTVFAMDT